MNRLRSAILELAVLGAMASTVWAQNQYIGYVYPAGGQQGTTFPIRIGGQSLQLPDSVIVTGVKAFPAGWSITTGSWTTRRCPSSASS